jgi:hypothetical protein
MCRAVFTTVALTLTALAMVGVAVSARRSAEVSEGRRWVFLAVAVLLIAGAAASWITLLL